MLALSLGAKRFLVMLAVGILGITIVYWLMRPGPQYGLSEPALQAFLTALGAALLKCVKEARKIPLGTFKEEALRMNSLARKLFRRLDTLPLVWSGKFDGVPVALTGMSANVGTTTELEVQYLINGEKHQITAEYVLAGSADDVIVWDGREVDADDVDFIVKAGFPRCRLTLNFQFTAGGIEHELSLNAKANLLDLLT